MTRARNYTILMRNNILKKKQNAQDTGALWLPFLQPGTLQNTHNFVVWTLRAVSSSMHSTEDHIASYVNIT